MTDTTEVLVVGAGPTGLAAAVALARHDVRCRVIDKSAQPSVHSRALGVQARTLEVFERLGVAHEALDAGWRVRRACIDAGGRLAALGLDQIASPYPYVLVLPQSETERILARRLTALGIQVERQVELVGLSQDDDGVGVSLRGPDGEGQETHARWLVGCDGAGSTVRHLLGLPFHGATYPEHFMLADIGWDWPLPSDEIRVRLAAGDLLAAIPRDEGHGRLIATVDPSQAVPFAQGGPVLDDVRALLERLGPPGARAHEAEWTSLFSVHRRIVPRMRVGRVVLAGDAAHIHSPAGGQGMNTGIQDADNLAWKLALVHRGAARADLVDSYEAERHPVAKQVLRGTDLVTRMITLRQPALVAARNRLLPIVAGSPPARRRLPEALAEVRVSYRGSPVVAPAWTIQGNRTVATTVRRTFLAEGPRPGDRAPDAAMTRVDGSTIRLFSLFGQDCRHTLLLCAADAEPGRVQDLAALARRLEDEHAEHITAFLVLLGTPAAVVPEAPSRGGILIDPLSVAHRAYGAREASAYLIRPDGYVGLRLQPPTLNGVHTFLRDRARLLV